MPRLPASAVLLLMGLLLPACGGDRGTGGGGDLDERLVGRWGYVGTNLYEVLALRVGTFYQGLGLPPAQVDSATAAVVAELRADAGFYDPEEVVTLRADGTWSSNRGFGERWRTSGDRLLMTGPGGLDHEIAYRYTLDGQRLTLVTTRDEALRLLSADDEIPVDLVGLFELVFQPEDRFRYDLLRLE